MSGIDRVDGRGSLKREVKDEFGEPSGESDISQPSACRVDTPCAMTGEEMPLRYCVKKSPISSEAERLWGTSRPSNSM